MGNFCEKLWFSPKVYSKVNAKKEPSYKLVNSVTYYCGENCPIYKNGNQHSLHFITTEYTGYETISETVPETITEYKQVKQECKQSLATFSETSNKTNWNSSSQMNDIVGSETKYYRMISVPNKVTRNIIKHNKKTTKLVCCHNAMRIDGPIIQICGNIKTFRAAMPSRNNPPFSNLGPTVEFRAEFDYKGDKVYFFGMDMAGNLYNIDCLNSIEARNFWVGIPNCNHNPKAEDVLKYVNKINTNAKNFNDNEIVLNYSSINHDPSLDTKYYEPPIDFYRWV